MQITCVIHSLQQFVVMRFVDDFLPRRKIHLVSCKPQKYGTVGASSQRSNDIRHVMMMVMLCPIEGGFVL